MNSRTRRLGTAAALLLALASVASAQGEPQDAEVPNFHRVNERLYRGAQPRPGGIQKLVTLGIKTIVNLRAADAHSRAEEAAARAAGLRYFNVPMHGYARPADTQVEQVLNIIDDPQNQPVFIHCKRGADRTGTVIAAYRISHDGWTSTQAKREATRYGMMQTQFEMRDYITDYHRRREGLGKWGDWWTDFTGTASTLTRRTLGKTYSITRSGLRRLKHSTP
jgi:tyrosine-protein phosphatase SIW14